jgi:hypothetical protein
MQASSSLQGNDLNTPIISKTPMTRWIASLIHLIISLAVISIVAAWVIVQWYPLEIVRALGVDKIMLLLGGVDLVMGPLMTLLVFKVGKPSLKFDLSAIALVQLFFLGFGLHSLAVTRPVYIVAYDHDFYLVSATEISEKHLAAASGTEYASLGFGKPRLVSTRMPKSPEAQIKIVASSLMGEGEIQTMPKYYSDYGREAKSILEKAKPLVPGSGISQAEAMELQNAARQKGYRPDELRFVNLINAHGNAVMLVRAQDGAVVGPVGVQP